MNKRSIVIIDDELLIRDLLYDFFSERNWQVSVYESADKCLETLRSRSYDVALIDIKMSDMDGLSLAAKIRDIYPLLPVVLMTAFPSVENAVEGIRLKVEDYFVKPFNINKLYKMIESLVEKRQTETSTPRSEKVPL
jgi:DNA-binding NtrC family response regulator